GRKSHYLKVRAGKAVLRGIRLVEGLCRDGKHWIGWVTELVHGAQIPVPVNVPLVQDHDDMAEGLEPLLDEALDELFGRLPPLRVDPTEDDADTPDDENSTEDASEEDAGRRLDAVAHQGLLDRIAVKVAEVRRRLS